MWPIPIQRTTGSEGAKGPQLSPQTRGRARQDVGQECGEGGSDGGGGGAVTAEREGRQPLSSF